ncbi:MAG: chitinase [Lachnospiraceae bacterium]|nr:chitinase [Lachnospiraceae bacterium]
MKKIIPALLAVVLILLIGGFYFGQTLLDRYSYSREKADLNEYYGLTGPDDVAVMLNDSFIDVHAKMLDDACYLTLTDTHELLNSRFYYSEADNCLIYTTPDTVITAEIGQPSYTASDGTDGKEKHAIARKEGENLWLLIDFVARYSDFTWELFTKPNRLRLTTEWQSFEQADITRKTSLRLLGGVKSEVMRQLERGEHVTVLEQMETWTKVCTKDAMVGYVENKRLSAPVTVEAVAPESKQPEYTSISSDQPVVLAWHAVAGAAGNDTLDELIAATNAGEKNGLNTISPTWFSLSDNEGNINSFASASYVNKAHDKGVAVWAAVDNFNGDGDAAEVLSRRAYRSRLIDRLMEESDACGLDGINVDFEGIPADSGEDYIEFIRELSIACRKKQLVLSIDNYVPMGALNDHYNRKEQGIVADYVIVMAYDEHYKGSKEAGSVASIGFVEEGIRRTVDEVPAEKVIGGIPFYTRVWATRDGSVDSDALDMNSAQEWVSQREVQLSWDEETCQNYGEFTEKDGTLRQVWMEDAESIRTKITVMGTYHIAGVAAWRLGYEKPEIWSAIAQALG